MGTLTIAEQGLDQPEEEQAHEESAEDPFGGKPPYQCMSCASCLHLVEDGGTNICLALPPKPILVSMTTQKHNDKLVQLSGGAVGHATTTMQYHPVYPQIAHPNQFRACSLYIMDPEKVKKEDSEEGGE